MIVRVADYLSQMGGSIDREHWLRPIPGRPGYAVLCHKPQYSKKEKIAMAKTQNVADFKALMAEAKRQYRDPVLRSEWEQKHVAAQREASRHQRGIDSKGRTYVPARLWDYIRQELSKSK